MKTPFVRRSGRTAVCLAFLLIADLGTAPLTAATFTVTTTNHNGAGSLQQAIIDANASGGPDLITFNIASGGLTISPTNAFPTIIDPVIIDGASQPGFAGAPIIELNGTGAGAGTDGLRIIVSNCVIRSLVINRFTSDGIEIGPPSGHDNFIEGCYLGLSLNGLIDQGNTLNGILITNGSANTIGGLDVTNRNYISGNNASGINITRVGSGGTANLILGNFIGLNVTNGVVANSTDGIRLNGPVNTVGGNTSGARNIISGNTGEGIEITTLGTDSVIRGNYIGTDPGGTVDRGNTLDGILVSARNVTIGGSGAGEGNLISGNNSDGIQLDGTNAVVLGNFIGTDTSGALGVANSANGVLIGGTSRSNLVGGILGGELNVIAFNGADGIAVTANVNSTNHTFRANSIHSNGDLGIDLGTSGITPNDLGDVDTGANNLQNFPVLTAVTNTAVQTIFIGSLHSRPSTTYTLDFFSSVTNDPSGAGEGQSYLGSSNVVTDASSNVNFSITLPTVGLLGRYISATATDPAGNTSEFSSNVVAVSTITGLTFTVVNTNDSGAGSLRQAIISANAAINAGDTIAFAITNLSTTIPLASALPTIIDPVTIDGYTQSGAVANTSPTAFNGTLPVRLSGTSAGTANGLLITIGNSTVRGLIITGFSGDGIELSGFGGSVIEGCIIGLDATGTDQGNTANGVFISGSSNNLVGGSTPAARNVISGNNSDGVEINGAAATSNLVLGNLLGTGLNGTTDLGNSADGVLITGAPDNSIGGTNSGSRNVLSGNGSDGVELVGAASTSNLILGNFIGTDAGGTVALPNAVHGIFLNANSRSNVVGGVTAGAANVISFNAADGINVTTSTNNILRGNSISLNGDLGIDLGTTGITANDAGDPDGGANQLQNFPVLSAVTNTPTQVLIYGSLNSRPSITYTLDFYSSVAFDASGAGEGQTWIGATNLATAADSNLTFAISLPVVNLQGRYVTATATDDGGNTSEFSTNIAAVSTVTGLMFTVVNTNNSGAGSLRQAILDANVAITAGDTIVFAITNLSTVIRPSSALPVIIDSVTIDGYTQPGSATNTSPTAFNATLLVKLDGVSAGAGVDGLAFTVGNNTVRGLDIINFAQDGIDLLNSPNNVIAGCVIGLDLNNTDAGNAADGIHLLSSGGNTIGGSGIGSRNVISGNNSQGIEILGTSTGNQILGNLIGLGLTGTTDLGNTSDGILINTGTGNTIGGVSPSARNVISGNNGIGIQLLNIASGITIRNNYIGTDVSGTLDVGNSGDGVHLNGAANVTILSNLISGNSTDGIEINSTGATNNVIQSNLIGTDVTGTSALANGAIGVNLNTGSRFSIVGTAGAGNVIAFNSDDGVAVVNGTNSPIRFNSIFSNGGLGIDLGTTGITTNDPGDADAGANALQNFPVLLGVTNTPTELLIGGSLNSVVSTVYTLDFYSSIAADSSGVGEGQTWLGSTNLSTDGGGNLSFLISLPVTNLAGRYVTATATDPNGNTSEFSTNFASVSTVSGLTFTVVNTNSFGPGSLRQAIDDANAAITAGDTIAFAITNPGSPKTIFVTGAILPAISDPVTINGYTQSGSVTNSSTNAFNGTLMVRLDGSNLGSGLDALRFSVGNNTVRGLVIIDFAGSTADGLEFTGGGNNVVQGNLIGIDVDGTVHANGGDGVRLVSSANNLIGGASPRDRNVISGNGSDGMEITGGIMLNNVIQGNLIGTDLSGTVDRGNSFHGVNLSAAGNTVGGATPGARNVIAGNDGNGVLIQATNNLVLGNYIGTDVSGTLDRGNNGDGVLINSGAGNTVGGGTVAARNVISGNNSDGVTCSGAAAVNNVIRGNIIGSDVTGQIDLGNSANGVFLSGAPANFIGGATAAEGNLISGNDSDGIEITGTAAGTNVINNNLIGTSLSGTTAIPNSSHGIFITSSAHDNVIGGSGNAISFNLGDGVFVNSGASNAIRRNLIFSNGGLGIDLGTDGVTPNDVNDVDTGANLLQNFPVLSAATNSLAGVAIAGALDSVAATSYDLDFFASVAADASGNGEGQVYLGSTNVTTDGAGHVNFLASFPVVLTGRYVTATATDPGGNTSEFSPALVAASTLAITNLVVTTTNNSGAGSLREAILLANSFISASNDLISFAIPGPGPHTITPSTPLPPVSDPMTLDGYTQPGASANSSCVSNNAVLRIRLSGAGAAIGTDGLVLQGPGGSIVRGLCIGAFEDGVQIDASRGNAVEGCFIGIDVDGVLGFLNTSSGIRISGAAASNNRVGGSTAAAKNVISFNSTGVYLDLAPSNVVSGNLIGTDPTGTQSRGNFFVGVTVSGLTAIGNRIGGVTDCERNVISGNGSSTFADHHGVNLDNTRSTLVIGNYIGLNATGTQSLGNGSSGVRLSASALNTIGGTTAAERNIISGNGYGVTLESTSPSNTISGNYIGTDATGTLDRGNTLFGVFFFGAANNLVRSNVISGNNNDALYVAGSGSPNARILGNRIGTDASGTFALANLGAGIRVEQSDTQIGGTNSGDGNTIAFNTSVGVSVNSVVLRCAILGNSIFSNNSLGIDLNVNGVTANDAGDADSGANGLQNFPALKFALSDTNTTWAIGSLDTRSNQAYRVEFFDNTELDPTGFGEGRRFAGSTNITTDANGHADFLVYLNPAPIGNFVTSTATDTNNNTSEFSAGVRVVPFNSIDLAVAMADSLDPASALIGFSYSITVTNRGPTNATGVVVTDTLPPGINFVSASSSQGSCTNSGGVVTCNLGTLNFTSNAVINISVTGTQTGLVTNTAVASANQIDHTITNNTDSETTFIGLADVAVRILDSPDPVVAGQPLTLTLIATNLGPDPATLAAATLDLDSTMVPTSNNVSQGSVQQFGNFFNFNAGTIPAGGSARLTVTAIPTESGIISHFADSFRAEVDPVPGNNSTNTTTTVIDGAGVLQFFLASYNANESGGQAFIAVQRTGGAIGSVSADFLTINGSAVSGLDYSNTVGTLSFTNGETVKFFTVPIVNDLMFECNEFFNVALRNPTGGLVLIGNTQAVVNVLENDLNLAGNVMVASGSPTFLPGAPGDDFSFKSSVSADGRYVAFASDAGNLVPEDDNFNTDVFVRDLLTQTTTLVSTAQGLSTPGSGNSQQPLISGNGRYVVFDSSAPDLVPNDNNSNLDVFVRDLLTGTTKLASVSTGGFSSGNNASFASSPTYSIISSNGQAVVYTSYAVNLVTLPDTNGNSDVFLFDQASNSNRLLSINLAHTGAGNAFSTEPVISANGQVAAFTTEASNVVSNDFNSDSDVIVYDIGSGTTELVSINVAGTGTAGGSSSRPFLSSSGRYVAFQSLAGDLVTGTEPLFAMDVFWRDRVTGITRLVSVSTNGVDAGNGEAHVRGISADGRYVVFDSSSGDLVPGDDNFVTDVFVRDMIAGTTELVSFDLANTGPGNEGSFDPVISGDGSRVAFESLATDLTAANKQSFLSDVFVRDLASDTTRLVSYRDASMNGGPGQAFDAAINFNGNVTSFTSEKGNGGGKGFAPSGGPATQTDIWAHTFAANTTELVSVATPSQTGFGTSFNPAVSRNGVWAAFTSSAQNLVTNDANNRDDVFVMNLTTSAIELMSVASSGSSGNIDSGNASISGDGGRVAFESFANDLVPDDFNSTQDIFVRDRIGASNILASANAAGTGSGNGYSADAAISPDGRYVVFSSAATDLTAGNDGNFSTDVFLRDLLTGTTALVSHRAASSDSGNGNSFVSVIETDPVSGRVYVAYVSSAGDLVNNDTNNTQDVFLYDVATGSNYLVSVKRTGTGSANGFSFDAQLTVDSASSNVFVVFTSQATDLANGDNSPSDDIYVYDLRSGTNRLVSVNLSGASSSGFSRFATIGGNGRYVAFQSAATDLVTGDTNSQDDIFLRDLVAGTTTLVTVNCDGTGSGDGFSYNPVISHDGAFVTYISTSTDLVPGDLTAAVDNVFRYDRLLGVNNLISQNYNLTGGGNDSCFDAAISGNGSTVVFTSYASNLVPTDANQDQDVFAWLAGTVTPLPNLVLDKSASTGAPIQFANFNYTLTVTNFGSAGATGVNVSDTLPPGVTFVSATTSKGSVTNSGATVIATIGSLSIGSGASIAITVTATGAGSVTNFANSTALEGDSVPPNNSDSVVINIVSLTPPVLSAASTNGTQLLIAWPASTPNVFVMETTTNLAPVIVWSPVTNSILDNGTFKFVLLNVNTNDPMRYFRLKH